MMTSLSEIIASEDGSTRMVLRYISGVESDNAICFAYLQAMDRQGITPSDFRANPPSKPINLTDNDWLEVQRIIKTF